MSHVANVWEGKGAVADIDERTFARKTQLGCLFPVPPPQCLKIVEQKIAHHSLRVNCIRPQKSPDRGGEISKSCSAQFKTIFHGDQAPIWVYQPLDAKDLSLKYRPPR